MENNENEIVDELCTEENNSDLEELVYKQMNDDLDDANNDSNVEVLLDDGNSVYHAKGHAKPAIKCVAKKNLPHAAKKKSTQWSTFPPSSNSSEGNKDMDNDSNTDSMDKKLAAKKSVQPVSYVQDLVEVHGSEDSNDMD